MSRTLSSIGYLKPYRVPLAWGVLMLLLTNACYLGVPEMMGRAVDSLGKTSTHHVLVLVGWMAGFAVATAVC